MNEIREAVRERYGRIAAEPRGSGCCGGSSGCGSPDPSAQSGKLGYSEAELASLPDGANLGLGCGNPNAIAALKPGETVLDLGSGAGIDCFLAAQKVGPSGHVIGVDMTPEMVSRSRRNADDDSAADNVDFRLGEIEHLPVADESVDVIISNCVVNLSTDKPAVFREAFRVLKPGGRLAISDIVATAELPSEVQSDLDAHTGCMAGATAISTLEAMLRDTGFESVQVVARSESHALVREWSSDRPLEDFLVSATIEARRPIGSMTTMRETSVPTEAVWEEFHQRLRSYLRGRVSNEADTEDLLQEVFTRIHANVHRIDELDNVTAWVYRIARNAVIDFYRAEAARRSRFISADDSALDATEPLAEDGASAASQLADCMEPLLTALPPHYAEPLALTELGGASHKDAAERMHLSLPAMKSRVSRGRRKLKALLLECCHVELDRRRGVADFRSRDASSCGCGDDCA